MKIGLLTDSHYSSAERTCDNRFNSQGLERIRKAVAAFLEAGCQRIICLGDLIDHEPEHHREVENLRQVASYFQSVPVPVTVVMGNHDGFSFTKEEFYGILGDACLPRDVLGETVSLVFVDACYFRSGKHYGPGDDDWTDTFIPDSENLQQRLDQATGTVYVFLHQNLDPTVEEHHLVANGDRIRNMMEQCGKVAGVYQGHFHLGQDTLWNGIRYHTCKALCTYEDAWEIVILGG